MAKKKILLLSDDLRMSSGVGTMSKEFVIGTIQHYDWVQVGGAITHPDQGKVINMDETIRNETGIKDASLTIYPTNGYGSQDLIREVLKRENPDAILHYTDPRFWGWLYEMEHEIRQEIPIFYYNIWDDWPAPQYNENYYESCDLMMNISKQTCAIVDEVAVNKPRTDWDSTYIPHGINTDLFYPIPPLHKEYEEMMEMKKRIFSIENPDDIEFVLFYNNRNIRRKMTSDALLAFQEFRNRLPEEKKDKVAFLMHTQPRDENGTDLPRLVRHLMPECNVVFSQNKLDSKQLNQLYNIADVTINIASNEGFGLGTAESLVAGTPIIVNVTGGLQDHCGFAIDGKYLTSEDYKKIKSLHDWRKWENNKDLTHGEWVKPVWPKTRALQGSVPTPYIFDDRADWIDVADNIEDWFNTPHEEREIVGELGRQYAHLDKVGFTAENMCGRFIKDMDKAFEMWKPRKRYEIRGV
jgi:glycosyltransferase involved in cell wall biosynthesis